MAKMGPNSGGNGAGFSYIFCHVPAAFEEKYAKRTQFFVRGMTKKYCDSLNFCLLTYSTRLKEASASTREQKRVQ